MNGIHAALEGRLTFDPELRYTPTGKPVCNLNVGVPDGKGGLEWARVTLWEELAEQMHQRLGKGDQVYVEGRLKLAEWNGQDGQRRSGLNISAWKCEPLGGIGRSAPRSGPVDEDAGDGRTVDLAEVARRQRIAAAAAEGTERAAVRAGGDDEPARFAGETRLPIIRCE